MATCDSGTLHYQGRGRRLGVEPSTTTSAATRTSTRAMMRTMEPRDPAPANKQTPGWRVVQKDAWEYAWYKNPVRGWMISGRARPIAIRWRSGRGLLPRQLRSIDGPLSCTKKIWGFSTTQRLFTIDRIYKYTVVLRPKIKYQISD